MLAAADLLDLWLSERLSNDTRAWLAAAVASARTNGDGPAFLLAFGVVPRKLGRSDLALSKEALAAAAAARRDFDPSLWTVDQAARTRLVLALPSDDLDAYRRTLDRLFADAELGELVALYQALPLLPHPHEHRARAAEGLRTNMKAVFEAVALRNPYPAEELDADAFDQLVLKCLFVGCKLQHVQGLDSRITLALARKLADFAHERWAAKRPVPPELWRGVGPVADGPLLLDLEHAIATGSDVDRAAVALAARHNPDAEGILAVHESALDRALLAFPTWEAVAEAGMTGTSP